MIEIDFSGWFQCRLATDPDDFDDPRGTSGWTFAMPDEPDLDRVIRFQNPVAPRTYGPSVGVRVQAVRRDGVSDQNHALINAVVHLDDNAVFEGRNGQIAVSATEPIVPFILRIETPEASLLASDPIDLADSNEVTRRQPIDFESDSQEVLTAIGVVDPLQYRAARRTKLQADLATARDRTHRASLELRIDELGKRNIRVNSMGFKLSYQFTLRGANRWTDPKGSLGPAPAAMDQWSVNYWVGGWDADALCGYVRGTLMIGT